MILGNTPVIQELNEQIEIIAPSSTSVVVIGETGTGKELVANALHKKSERGKHNLVKVNCAAIQDTLLESELFGHVKGAFTNAHTKKLGKMHIADGGTLVLDEISNMSWVIQAKILRAVEHQQFEMVGGTESFSINTRFVSLSNRNMLEMINKNEFREDLYYRLGGVTLTVPPLRERLDDIPLLTTHYVKFYKEKLAKHVISSISAKAIEKLQSYYWPGNIRELMNVIEQSVLFCFDKKITETHIKLPTNKNATTSQRLIKHTVKQLSTDGYHKRMQAAIEDIELEWIESCLKQADYVQKSAAQLMGISQRVLCYKITKHRKRTGKEITDGVPTISKG